MASGIESKYRRGRTGTFRSPAVPALRRDLRRMPMAFGKSRAVKASLKPGAELMKARVMAASYRSFADRTGKTRKTIRVDTDREGNPQVRAGDTARLHEFGWTLRDGSRRPARPFFYPALRSASRAGAQAAARSMRSMERKIVNDVNRMLRSSGL